MTFRRGRTDIPKLSANIGFKASERLGVVAVCDTGEFEAEVVVIETEERILVLSKVLSESTELQALLDRVLDVVAVGEQ